jgi:hypothetical protein
MKKFQFLLLDAGPIIKLFELNLWDTFIEKCNVTISRTVANQAKFARRDFTDVRIDLNPYEEKDSINIIEVELPVVQKFYKKFNQSYQPIIHNGEKETLAFLCNSSDNWLVCAADAAVFRVLGFLGKSECGISLEEILKQTGMSQSLEWEFTKKFREQYTHKGQIDAIQNNPTH